MKYLFLALFLISCSNTGDPAGPSESFDFLDTDADVIAYDDTVIYGSYIYDDDLVRFVVTLSDNGFYAIMMAVPNDIGSNTYLEEGEFTYTNEVITFRVMGSSCSENKAHSYEWGYSLAPFTLYLGPHALPFERPVNNQLIERTPLTLGCFRDVFEPDASTYVE